MPPDLPLCFSIRNLARRWHIAPKKVRAMIRRGMLKAIDLGHVGGRCQMRITPEAVHECERLMAVGPVRRSRRRDDVPEDIRALLEA